MNDTLKITHQNPIVGKITLSGDTVSTLITIIARFFVADTLKLSNVPRSKLLIDSLDILAKTGIKSRWTDLDKLTFTVHDKLNADLSGIEKRLDFDLVKLLVPLMLFRESKCIINLASIDEAKFYKKIGFTVSQLDKKIVISVPSFLPEINKLETDLDDTIDQAARVFLNFIYHDLISIKYSDDNLAIKNILEVKKSGDIVINTSLAEFAFYSTLAAISRGECIFDNIHISEILQFLVLLEQVGVKYEAYNNKLKLWASDFNIESYYDLTSCEPIVVGYLLVILFRHNHSKNIRVLVKRSYSIKEILRDFNILGLEVTSRNINDDTNYELIHLKIVKSISPVKFPSISIKTGGAIIAAAAGFAGSHKIGNINNFSIYFPYLNDNLAILKLGDV